jgi:hypothetical protein
LCLGTLAKPIESMLFLKEVLVEERGPVVAPRAFPWNPERWVKGAASPKSERRIPFGAVIGGQG